jgi:hypothetical protein
MEVILRAIILKYHESKNATKVMRKVFIKWVDLVNMIYVKKTIVNKSLKIYQVLYDKHLKIKYLYFKKFFLNTTSKVVLKVSKINNAKIDLNIIQNQSTILPILDNEDKLLDLQNEYLTAMLFGINTNCKNHKNVKPSHIYLLKLLSKMQFNKVSSIFRKWKNMDWKYQSLDQIIEKYNHNIVQRNSLLNTHYAKKAEFSKVLKEFNLHKINQCRNCLDGELDIDYMSVNMNNNEINEENADMQFNSTHNNNKLTSNNNIQNIISYYKPNINNEFENENKSCNSNYSETKKLDFNLGKEFDFSKKNEFMSLSNNTTIKERIDTLEKRIKLLNLKYNKTKSINEELSSKKFLLFDMINKIEVKK